MAHPHCYDLDLYSLKEAEEIAYNKVVDRDDDILLNILEMFNRNKNL